METKFNGKSNFQSKISIRKMGTKFNEKSNFQSKLEIEMLLKNYLKPSGNQIQWKISFKIIFKVQVCKTKIRIDKILKKNFFEIKEIGIPKWTISNGKNCT